MPGVSTTNVSGSDSGMSRAEEVVCVPLPWPAVRLGHIADTQRQAGLERVQQRTLAHAGVAGEERDLARNLRAGALEVCARHRARAEHVDTERPVSAQRDLHLV